MGISQAAGGGGAVQAFCGFFFNTIREPGSSLTATRLVKSLHTKPNYTGFTLKYPDIFGFVIPQEKSLERIGGFFIALHQKTKKQC